MLQEQDPIIYAFNALIGRDPNDTEYKLLRQQLDQGIVDMKKEPKQAESWISAGAYQRKPDLDSAVLAANTIVATTIMNFDEFVMKR